MKNPLKTIKELILILPEKDAKLCSNFLSKRNFEGILEIVKSDIYKVKKDATEESPDDYVGALIELEAALTTYMSYLDVTDSFNNDDDY